MEITINVKDVIAEIETALQEYEKEYAKLLKLYLGKLEKYTEYVKKQIEKPYKGWLRSAPVKPSWLRDNFIQSLDALKAHTKDTVVMDDREYNDIHSGLLRLRQDITTSTATLNSLSY